MTFDNGFEIKSKYYRDLFCPAWSLKYWVYKMLFIGECVLLYFLKLSASNSNWAQVGRGTEECYSQHDTWWRTESHDDLVRPSVRNEYQQETRCGRLYTLKMWTRQFRVKLKLPFSPPWKPRLFFFPRLNEVLSSYLFTNLPSHPPTYRT